MTQRLVQIAADASFYSLVHELIEAEKSFARECCSPADQRAADRRQFDCQQLLAPFDGVRLPSQSEFRPVACQDLSPGGFSFVQTDRVEFEELVVALGQVPFKFFTARVQNQSRVRLRGRFAYRIGCRFTGRIVAD
ncbi:MAG: hypothetical protein WD894_09795 [Pirellulales bacterium]